MNIKVRQTTQEDAIFLTSISFGAKRDKDYAGDDIRKWYDKLKVTQEYIDKNTVFVAEDEHIILGYCAIRKVEEVSLVDGLKLKAGYWLEYIFVKPEFTSKGIGHSLFNTAKEYCKEQNIEQLNILCEKEIRTFFETLGATYVEKIGALDQHVELYEYQYVIIERNNESEEVNESEEEEFKELKRDEEIQHNWHETDQKQDDVNNGSNIRKATYEEGCNWEALDGGKLEEKESYEDEELENEAYEDEELEDEIYENEELGDQVYEDEELGDDAYEDEEQENDEYGDEKLEDEVYEDKVDEKENVYTQIDRKSKKEEQSAEEDQNEFAERLNYENFLKSTVDIGYKFECEELAEKAAEAEEKKRKINYTKVVGEIKEEESKVAEGMLEATKDDMEQVGFEPLTKAELEVLIGNAKNGGNEETPQKQQILSIEKKNDEKANHGGHQASREGQLYIAWGDEIANSKKRARALLREFNNLDTEDIRLNYSILSQLLGKIGDSIHIEPNFQCSYGYNISVGEGFCAGYNCVILDEAKVTIGDYCILSPQVGIYTQSYPIDAKKRRAGYEYAKPINIGNNVWIGGNSIINPGVTIGNNVVIQAGSVVSEDIPDNVVVCGNPAKIIKRIEQKII